MCTVRPNGPFAVREYVIRREALPGRGPKQHVSKEANPEHWGRRVRRYERFVIAPVGGAPGNEYRVSHGQVEFRVVNNHRGAAGSWRTLTPEEVLMHVHLNTSVGQWLVKRVVTGVA